MIRVAPAGRRERGKPIGPSRQSDCLERCCPASCTRSAFAARATALAGPLWTVGSVRFVGSVRSAGACVLYAVGALASGLRWTARAGYSSRAVRGAAASTAGWCRSGVALAGTPAGCRL